MAVAATVVVTSVVVSCTAVTCVTGDVASLVVVSARVVVVGEVVA